MNKVSIIALKNGYVIGHADHLYQDHSVAKTLDEVCEIVRSHFEPEDEPQFSKPEGPGWMPFSENKPNWLRDNQVMQAAFPSGNMWTYYAAAQKLLGVDVSWVRVAPPERPEGFIEYDFNGQPVADDVEVKLLFWDGYISPKRKAKDAIWPTFEKTDELLTSDNWEQARFAYCVIEKEEG